MFGTHLRALRQSRGLTIEAASACAGLSRRSLTRWECGESSPRIPELNALLGALQISTAERHDLLEHLRVPRGVRVLRANNEADGLSAPGAGELLWALRLRKGWTLETTAEQLGVNATTIGRWEQSETRPSAEQLKKLCRLLGAEKAETTAICNLHLNGASSSYPRTTSGLSVSALQQAWIDTERSYLHPGGYSLYNLRCHVLTVEAYKLLRKHPSVRLLLCEIMVAHLRHLSLAEMHPAAARVANRLIELSKDERVLRRTWVYSQITLARSITDGADWLHRDHSGSTRKPKTGGPAISRAIYLLQSIGSMPTDPTLDSWLHGLLARLYCLEGSTGAAIEVACHSVQLAQRTDDDYTMNARTCDLAAVLQYSCKPSEAIDHIAYSACYDPATTMHTKLVHASVLADLGERNEARHMLSKLNSLVDDYNFLHFKAPVAQLRRRLED